MCSTFLPKCRLTMLREVDTRAASFASSGSPNRHAMMYTIKEPFGKKVLRCSLKIRYIDVMLYLSAAENKAVRVNMLPTFGGSTPGYMNRRIVSKTRGESGMSTVGISSSLFPFRSGGWGRVNMSLKMGEARERMNL